LGRGEGPDDGEKVGFPYVAQEDDDIGVGFLRRRVYAHMTELATTIAHVKEMRDGFRFRGGKLIHNL
jgi:hypothetical protein